MEVRGAREHNLREVDVALPRDAVVAFTGISGSGKSSLAFSTIFRPRGSRPSELQRSRLSGTLYLLDEPATGLHPADVERLLRLLQDLVDAGSTVVAVEHDAAVALAADWLVDLGPGGGGAGGRLVDTGPPLQVARRALGPTGAHLARQLRGVVP